MPLDINMTFIDSVVFKKGFHVLTDLIDVVFYGAHMMMMMMMIISRYSI